MCCYSPELSFIYFLELMHFLGLHICVQLTAEIEDEFGCYVMQFLKLTPLAAHTVIAMWKIVPGKTGSTSGKH